MREIICCKQIDRYLSGQLGWRLSHIGASYHCHLRLDTVPPVACASACSSVLHWKWPQMGAIKESVGQGSLERGGLPWLPHDCLPLTTRHRTCEHWKLWIVVAPSTADHWRGAQQTQFSAPLNLASWCPLSDLSLLLAWPPRAVCSIGVCFRSPHISTIVWRCIVGGLSQ